MIVSNKLEVRLNAVELKQAIIDYLIKNGKEEIAEFLEPNKWALDYLYRSKQWSLLIDGIYEEREVINEAR